jgi:hypothetical protein
MSILKKIYSVQGFIKSLELTSNISSEQLAMLKVMLNELLHEFELEDDLLMVQNTTDNIKIDYPFKLRDSISNLGTKFLNNTLADCPYEQITNKRPIKVRCGKKHFFIKTNGQRVNLESNFDHSSLESGITYYFSEDRLLAKQVQNII